jgi:hypothetical protein
VDYRLLQHIEGEPERERGGPEEGVQEAGDEVASGQEPDEQEGGGGQV